MQLEGKAEQTEGENMRDYAKGVGFLLFALILVGCAATNRVKFETGATYSWDKDRPQIAGLLSRPAGEGRSPAVVLLHTCGGLLPHVTQDWPAYLTGLGYVVLSVDSYTSRGYSRCTERTTWKNDQTKDAFGALDYLVGLPFVDGERIAVMGFSVGAFAINDYVINRSRQRTGMRNYKAAISLYGRCDDPLRLYTDKDIPLMQIIGEFDAFRDICEGEWMKNQPIEVHVLKGAYHAFDHPQITFKRRPYYIKIMVPDPLDNPMLYDAAKTREARGLTRAFLDKHL